MGAFLKGVCKGELLSCISKDGNNQMYPVAWAVVEKETKDTWSWFIKYLMHDLELVDNQGEGLTIMSDMQKGLILAVRDLLPYAEHRMCARHIWSNWKQNWRGEERRNQFWRCSKASFEVLLEDELGEMEKLGDHIVEDLLKYPKETWCRALFREGCKCDIVENNMCETFNSWILAARHKSIITMLEEIRRKMMDRIIKLREFSEKWWCDVSPMAMDILGKNAKKATECELKFNGDAGYEVIDEKYQHTVDMRSLTCSCRSWQLRGIPCAHAISAMHHGNVEPETYIAHWYWKETYLKAFSNFIQPMTNMKMWPATSNPRIEPPEFTRMPGRPKKNRRKAPDEPKKKFGKLSRKGRVMTCSHCKTSGHNKKGCPSLRNIASNAGSEAETSVATSQANTQGSAATSTSVRKKAAQPKASNSVRKKSSQPAASTAASGMTCSQPINAPQTTVASTTMSSSQPTSSSVNKPNMIRTPGGNVGFKRPRSAGYGVLFGPNGSVIERSGVKDRVIHNASTVKHSAPTNIESRFKPPGLKWQGKNAVTGRQLEQQ